MSAIAAAVVTFAVVLFAGVGCATPPPPVMSDEQWLQDRLVQLLPDHLDHIIPRVEIIEGSTSFAYPTHIAIAESTMAWGRGHLVLDSTLAHEWGHYEAMQRSGFGFHAPPPAGFPLQPRTPTFPNVYPNWDYENWAMCVATSLTGSEAIIFWYEHQYPTCTYEQLEFTRQYLVK